MAKKSKSKKIKPKKTPETKGRVKELLFDINENKFIDPNGSDVKDQEQEELLIDSEDLFKRDKDELISELMSDESRDDFLSGKEKFDEIVSKGATTANVKLKETKDNLSKAGDKAKESFRQISEKAKPLAASTGKSIKKGVSATGSVMGSWMETAKKSVQKGGFKQFAKDNMITLIIALLVVVIGGGVYIYRYQKLPHLSETHAKNAGASYKTYPSNDHPMEIFSSVKENLEEHLGMPTHKGDGKTPETRYLVYSIDWFGAPRKTILFYNGKHQFTKIKLEIGNESAQSIYEKLKTEFGTPFEDKDPTVKGGYAIWIKDAVRYKMMHRGTYSTIEISLAEYDNPSGLDIGKNPITIHYLNTIDLNGDGKVDEKILLLGARGEELSPSFAKLYLLIWDGKKTYVRQMNADYDGGSFPQINFQDTNGDKREDIVISALNNIVTHYNVFDYTGEDVKLIYSGYEEPAKEK